MHIRVACKEIHVRTLARWGDRVLCPCTHSCASIFRTLRGFELLFQVGRADLLPSTPSALTLCVCSSSFHAYTFSHMLSPDPSISSFENPCICCRKNIITRSCSSHMCLTDQQGACLFPPLVRQIFKAWRAITDPRLPATNLICSNSHPAGTAALSAWMMPVC